MSGASCTKSMSMPRGIQRASMTAAAECAIAACPTSQVASQRLTVATQRYTSASAQHTSITTIYPLKTTLQNMLLLPLASKRSCRAVSPRCRSTASCSPLNRSHTCLRAAQRYMRDGRNVETFLYSFGPSFLFRLRHWQCKWTVHEFGRR